MLELGPLNPVLYQAVFREREAICFFKARMPLGDDAVLAQAFNRNSGNGETVALCKPLVFAGLVLYRVLLAISFVGAFAGVDKVGSGKVSLRRCVGCFVRFGWVDCCHDDGKGLDRRWW